MTGLFTASMLPVMLGISALTVDAGLWTVAETRLQYAADAAAVSAGYLLANSQSKGAAVSAFQSVALAAAQDALGVRPDGTGVRLVGTLQTPVGVSVADDKSSVTVTLTSTPSTYFAGAVGFKPSVMTATATAGLKPPPVCVQALSSSTSQAIKVESSSSITASNCGVYSNSPGSGSVYVNNLASISAASVGAAGGVSAINLSSISPATQSTYGGVLPDPFASKTAPAPTPTPDPVSGKNCDYKNYNNTRSANLSPGVYCGNTTFGANLVTLNFAPGIYYIVDGNLNFTDLTTINQSAGVTFVMTGPNVGALNWNNATSTSTVFTAPTSGATAGFVFWQTCPSSGTTVINAIGNLSTLALSGAFYSPCGELRVSNTSKLVAPSNGSMSVVASRIWVYSLAAIQAGSTSASSNPNAVALKQ